MGYKFKKVTHMSKTLRRRSMILLLAVIAILALGILELTNTTHIFHKNKVAIIVPIPNTTSNSVKNTQSKSTNNSSALPQSSEGANNKVAASPPTNTSSSVLVSPYGSFVSNHRPSLSNSSSSSQEQSVCTTTPGASCYIEFTQGSTTKRLASQTVDNSGSTTWVWDVKQNGFSEGTWQVTAVATLGNQTKTTVDQFNLEVQP